MNYSRTIIGVAILIVVGSVILYVLRGTPLVTPSPVATASPLADDTVRIDAPLPGSRVASPLKVTGMARGNWFFEATFPVTVTDWDGKIIAQTHATAQGDWMTTDWVPFEATVVFDADTSVSSRGALILKKDNPSGEAKYDDYREMTIFFQ